jgi:hypothetical protein
MCLLYTSITVCLCPTTLHTLPLNVLIKNRRWDGRVFTGIEHTARCGRVACKRRWNRSCRHTLPATPRHHGECHCREILPAHSRHVLRVTGVCDCGRPLRTLFWVHVHTGIREHGRIDDALLHPFQLETLGRVLAHSCILLTTSTV